MKNTFQESDVVLLSNNMSSSSVSDADFGTDRLDKKAFQEKLTFSQLLGVKRCDTLKGNTKKQLENKSLCGECIP